MTMAAIIASEAPVNIYQTAQCINPEVGHIHTIYKVDSS
jgi:hypothetical protein